ncbi:MAG: hypothetical protein DRP56_02670 [Planctomycetota bacterium]|nr:MAG: hypothetical protein DRP56_02670 [Planctomycetota bacterium]
MLAYERVNCENCIFDRCVMSNGQLLLFDLLENKKQREVFSLPEMWSIDRLCEKYYQFKKTDGCSCSFLNSSRRHLQYFTDWVKQYGFDTSGEKLSDLNSVILSDYRQYLAENTKISVVTANVYIAHVRMLLFWAENIHGLSHPPMGVIRLFRKNKVKKGHGRKQDRSAISWDELERLFVAASVVDTALLLLGLNCGFGNTDIATLKLCDIDLEAATVSHERPKTGVARNFGLWPETVEILKRYIEKHRGKPAREEFAELVFINNLGNPFCWERIDEDGTFRRSDAIKNRFIRLYKRAGLQRPYGRGFYSMRHTAATQTALGSNDPSHVQAILGHQSLNAQKFYRHDQTQKAKQAQQKIHDQLKETLIPRIIGARYVSFRGCIERLK